jgi:predicted porin
MRLLVIASAALLATTASAQTPPAAEAADPVINAPATAAAAPAKDAATGFTIKAADGTLTVYGLIDGTIGTQDNMDASGARQTGFRTAWFSGNRWGFLTRHGVGEGLAIISKLEGEYTVANGAFDTNNVIFNRDAWLGFDSDVAGQFTFGRQNTLARDFAQNYGDAYGSAGVRMDEGGWTNTNNFKQLIYYAAGYNGGTRVDNGMNWKKKFGDFLVGAAYAMGNQTGQFSKNGTACVGAAWNGGPFNISGYYTQANNSNNVQKAYAIGGNIQPITLVRVNAGVFGYSADQNAALGKRTDLAWTVSAKLSPAPVYDVELGYVSMHAKNAAQSGTGASANTLNPFKDASTATVAGDGTRATIYASAFYHLSKRAEVYLAGDYLSVKDNYKVAATNGHSNQTEFVTGMRYKF